MLYRPQVLVNGEWESVFRTISDYLDADLVKHWNDWAAESPTDRRMYSSE